MDGRTLGNNDTNVRYIPQMVKSEHHCFTKYNYDTDYIERLRDFASIDHRINYICWGYEICPSTERKHLQGYVQLRTRVEGKSVTALLHCDNRVCDGSDEDNYNYCSKEDSKDPEHDPHFEEYGERRAIKRKSKVAGTRLHEACALLNGGGSLQDVINEYPDVYVKFHAGIEKLCKYKTFKYFEVKPGPYRWDVTWPKDKSVIVFGQTGLGKTEYVKYCFPKALFATHIDDLMKFRCGKYDSIIFDDCSFTHIPDRAQLHLVDQDNDRSIHIRYGTVSIPAGTPKIFMHNNKRSIVNYWDFPEIRRRVDILELRSNGYSFIL